MKIPVPPAATLVELADNLEPVLNQLRRDLRDLPLLERASPHRAALRRDCIHNLSTLRREAKTLLRELRP